MLSIQTVQLNTDGNQVRGFCFAPFAMCPAAHLLIRPPACTDKAAYQQKRLYPASSKTRMSTAVQKLHGIRHITAIPTPIQNIAKPHNRFIRFPRRMILSNDMRFLCLLCGGRFSPAPGFSHASLSSDVNISFAFASTSGSSAGFPLDAKRLMISGTMSMIFVTVSCPFTLIRRVYPP